MNERPVSPAFRDALEAQREGLNTKFRLRLAQGAKLDASDFQLHVRDRVGPIIDAVQSQIPERTRIAISELYDVSLDLFAAKHLGGEVESPRMTYLWQTVLPGLSGLIARDPRQVVGRLCNGLLFAEQQDPQVAQRWIQIIEKTGVDAASVEQLLTIGKFAAWISGMAQYRQSALAAAKSLPWQTVAKLIGMESVDEATVQQCLESFETNPWTQVRQVIAEGKKRTSIEWVQTCCAFRGYGGAMLAPPRVIPSDGRLLVTDEKSVWQLVADRFGWVMLRVDTPPDPLKPAQSKAKVAIDEHDTVRWDKERLPTTGLANPTSFAFDGQTLAATIASSFHVFLFARS